MTDDAYDIVVIDTDAPRETVVVTDEDKIEIVEVNDNIPGDKGDKGDKGEPGTPGRDGGISLDQVNELYVQNVATDTWVLTYDLPYVPTVTVVDSAGSTVEGEVRYVSNNKIQIKFAVSFSGTAYLS